MKFLRSLVKDHPPLRIYPRWAPPTCLLYKMAIRIPLSCTCFSSYSTTDPHYNWVKLECWLHLLAVFPFQIILEPGEFSEETNCPKFHHSQEPNDSLSPHWSWIGCKFLHQGYKITFLDLSVYEQNSIQLGRADWKSIVATSPIHIHPLDGKFHTLNPRYDKFEEGLRLGVEWQSRMCLSLETC